MQVVEFIARAVILHDEKLLLCRKVGAPWYFLPGGHVEFGEETKTALAREVQEELGVEGAVGNFIGIVENIFTQEGKERHEVNLVFEVSVAETNLSSKEDHIEFAWIDKEKLQEKQVYPVALKHSILQWMNDRIIFTAFTTNVFDQIRSLLNEQGIEYKLSEHALVRTSEEAAKIRGVELKTGAKAMVIKANETFFLFVLPGDRKIDWGKVKKILGKNRLRFATEEEAEQVTRAKVGAIPPLGNILGLATYLDKKVLENEWINFNPGSRTHSIAMKSSDLARVADPIIEEFSV